MVIGMITGKSDNENLNYALPIDQVLGVVGKTGEAYNKIIYSLPNCNYQKLSTFQGEINLPQPFSMFREQLSTRFIEFNKKVLDSLISENGESYFPQGKNSQDVLHTTQTTTFPNLIAQRKDGTSGAFGPKERQTFNLDGNGKLIVAANMFGYFFFQINAPDSVPLDVFYRDDKQLFDHLLTGIKLTRDIGNSETRITSLGLPCERKQHRDSYGRIWLIRSWLLPHSDEKAVLFSLPTPQGLVGYMRLHDYGRLDAGILPDMYYMTDYLYISYYATLWRWKQFLSADSMLPSAMSDVSFSYEPGKSLALKTKRFSADIGHKTLKVTDNSDLQLKYSYYLENGRVIWDIAGALFGEDKDNANLAVLMRHVKPTPSVSEDVRQSWTKAAYRQYPYNKTLSVSEKSSSVKDLHPMFLKMDPGARLQTSWLYSTTFQLEGRPDEKTLRKRLDAFNDAVAIRESIK
jgi:hypothetical protein